MTPGMPGDPEVDGIGEPPPLRLAAPGVAVTVDLVAGGRIGSFVVDGHELLRTTGESVFHWGSYPMVPWAGRTRDAAFSFDGRRYDLPVNFPPHAIHGTTLVRRWQVVGDGEIATDLGPDWPFAGRAVQAFSLSADALTCRLELHADEVMPASIGWHPWFVRRPEGLAGQLELEFEAGAMYVRDGPGIATAELVPPPPGPWDDCFTNVRRPPLLRWPGFLELTIESGCPDWVVYTEPVDALCVEPQTAPPDALNGEPAIVEPGRPLVAEMTWRWRRLAS
jgi:aldose 1-epimerase